MVLEGETAGQGFRLEDDLERNGLLAEYLDRLEDLEQLRPLLHGQVRSHRVQMVTCDTVVPQNGTNNCEALRII